MDIKAIGLFFILICMQAFGAEDAASVTPKTESMGNEKMRDVELIEMPNEKAPNSKITDVSCESGKCVVNVSSDKKGSKIATDVHVKVITNIDGKMNNKKNPNTEEAEDEDDDDDDIPIVKGMIGVAPEDIKPDSEEKDQASEILTVPNSDDLIVINDKPANPKPSKPSIYPPNRNNVPVWKRPQWKPSFYPGSNEIPRRPPNCKPEDEIEFHLYNIGKPPRGWSYPDRNPGDYRHKTNFAPSPGYDVQYTTECQCTRTPVYRPKPMMPPMRPSYPWYPPVETTTKVNLDGKLLPPFNKEEKRRM